jgi:hypothetical protein
VSLVPWIGAVFCVGGLVASFVFQGRLEAALEHEDEAIASAYGRSAKVGVAGVALGLIAFFALPAGPSSLGSMVFFLGGPVLVYVMRRRVSSGRLARLALWSMIASLALFGGATAFLLGGGRVSTLFGGS